MFNRKKIASQEELHDYLRVTSPRLWMILGAVALMLVGFIVYAATATICRHRWPHRLRQIHTGAAAAGL